MNKPENGSHRRSTGQFGRRVTAAVVISVLIVGLIVLVALTINTWFAVYVGILLAIFITTLSNWLTRFARLPPKWSVAAVLVGLTGLLALAGWWLAGPLTRETRQLQQRLPGAIDYVKGKIHSAGLDRFAPEQWPDSSQIAGATGSIASKALTVFTGTVQSVATILVVIFLGIYLSFSPAMYLTGLICLFPISKREKARRLLAETGDKLRHWIVGQIISMIAVGGLIALGLFISGVPLPLVLGFIAGLLDIIPIFGPIIAAIPALLIGFTVSPWHALCVVIVFVIANQIESHLLVPIIQRYSVSLPPALTVVALLLMGSLFGFWGLLLAAPLTATVLVLVKRVYVGEILGDKKAQNEHGTG